MKSRNVLLILAALALSAICCLSGCMELPNDRPGPQSDESSLAKEIRSTGITSQAATNYADLFDGMAQLCGSPAVKTTEDLKRAEVNGRDIIGQGHTEALVPIVEREFAILKDPKPLDESLRAQCRQAFERMGAAMRECSR